MASKIGKSGSSSRSRARAAARPKGRFDSIEALKALGVNVFVTDQDQNLIFMNDQAEKTLRGMEDVLRSELNISVDELLGSPIDRFHGSRGKHIRQMLSDPKNLPHKADIRLGKLTLELNVRALFNA
jgi:methyl-accepting chemotaxis protein